MSSEKADVGVGIVGVGARGLLNFGRGFAKTAQETGFRLMALCDRTLPRMQEGLERITNWYREEDLDVEAELYTDVRDLANDPRVDVVVITSPTHMHLEHVRVGLEAGKKVYCDKPLAQNAEDAVAIVEECREHDSHLVLGFTRRYEAVWRKAHELVREGRIGRVLMMQYRAVLPHYNSFMNWHRQRQWSGGVLNDKGSHFSDVFNWFSGARATQVQAFGGQAVFRSRDDAPQRCSECDRDCRYRENPISLSQEENLLQGESWDQEREEQYRRNTCVFAPGADIFDHTMAQFQYENGTLASLLFCLFAPRAENQETLEVIGDTGRLIVYRHKGLVDLVSDYGKQHEVIDCKHPEFQKSHFGADWELIRELRRFYDGRPPVVGENEGLEATRMVMAMQTSADEGGRSVRMDEISDCRPQNVTV